jgi:hypothetical protein
VSQLGLNANQEDEVTEPTDLKNLQMLRDRRRYVANDAIETCAVNREDLSQTGRSPEIVALQNLIEGLDRAIVDEKALMKPKLTVTELDI